MSSIDNLAKDLYKVMHNSEEKGPKPYDPIGTVVKVDDNDNDILWVRISGSDTETPVEKTINASPGDNVRVRVSGGRAWVIGNTSNPPTDDTKAKEAIVIAVTASEEADRAKEAADTAWVYADSAHSAAIEANHQAVRATGYANDALTELSIVEDVSGTLAWIQKHGSYIPTTDTTVQEGTVYFIYNSETGDYEPIVSPDPTKNPQSEGWYILDIRDSQSNFIMAHLAVTSRGLWVLPGGLPDQDQTIDPETDAGSPSDTQSQKQANANARQANDYKVLLSNDGMYIYDDAGHLVTIYGESIIFDSSRPQSIGGENAYILFHDTNDDDIPDTITIGGNVVMNGSNETLSEMLSDIKATAEGTLIYDHTYVLSADKQTATFTAHVYRGGQEVTNEFSDEQFTWYYKVEHDDDPIPINTNNLNTPPNSGKTISVSLSLMKYGGEVVGYFTTTSNVGLLTHDGDRLADANQRGLIARTTATGNTVRVRDLEYTSTIYPTDSILIVTSEAEKLATLATVSDLVDKHYVHNQQSASATWSINHNLNKYPSVSVVDSAGTYVIGDVAYVDANNLTVSFQSAFSGKAYMN